MSLPCLDRLLASNRPVVVCAQPWARDLLSAYPIAGFIPMTSRWRVDRRAVQAFRNHADHTYPVGLLLPDSLSSAMIFKFAGIPSAGHRDDGRSLILRWPMSKSPRSLHAVESWYRLTRLTMKKWGLTASVEQAPASLELRLTSTHHQTAHLLMKKYEIEGGRFVLIAPTAVGLHRGKNKVWPHFDTLTRNLQKKGHTVVMCPPPSETQQARENAPTAQCLPSLGLGAFAALARQAALVVCNDSGVSHLAAAANARQLTLFGVTSQERTGPWSVNANCLGSAAGWPDLKTTEQKALRLIQENKGD